MFKTLTSLTLLLAITTAVQAESIPITSLGIVKGDAKNYINTSKYKLIKAKAIIYDNWSTLGFLLKDGKNHITGMSDMISKTVDDAEDYGQGYCRGYLNALGYKSGYSLVDNYDVIFDNTDDIIRTILTANTLCYVKK